MQIVYVMTCYSIAECKLEISSRDIPRAPGPAECNAIYELSTWLIAVVKTRVFPYVCFLSLLSSMLNKRLVYHTRGLAYVHIQAVLYM